MSATLVVELFCEELPPRALRKLGGAFASGIADGLAARGLLEETSSVQAYATPRRLGARIVDVKAKGADQPLEAKLMPLAVARNAEGKASDALRKRLAKDGRAALAELFPEATSGPDAFAIRKEGNAEYVYLKTVAPGQSIAGALQAALEEALAKLPIPKVMTYQLADGTTDVKFVRPAHGLVALHGSEVVDVQVLGIRSGRTLHGHRFQGARDIALASADEYDTRLREEGGVIAEFDARKAEIRRQLDVAAAAAGSSLGPEEGFAALLDEVTALVEMPTVYAGTFDAEFLEVPAECLVLTMRQNQKYFPLFAADGRLTNRFLIVSNMRLADPGNVVRGNERVVRPRLADARFFFETDKKVRLVERVKQLGAIVYHGKLGTQLQRVDRLRKLAVAIQGHLPRGEKGREWADRAAELAKADLVTLMVGEFPELQGTMGRYYAESDGEQASVARAIEQHYWPRFSGDALPTGDASIAVALADRLDALAGLFFIGQRPTGDKDPFALRRAALGIVRILMETPLAMELYPLIHAALRPFVAEHGERMDTIAGEIWLFIRERLENLLRERGFTAHEVAAVLEVESDESRYDRLDLVPRKLDAIRAFAALPEAQSLAAANKRISNILRQAAGKGEQFTLVDGGDLEDPLERALHAALEKASAAAGPQFEQGNYAEYLRSFAVLKAPVDAFFDGVMVMVEDSALRRRRLNLLHTLQWQMNRVADLSKLAA